MERDSGSGLYAPRKQVSTSNWIRLASSSTFVGYLFVAPILIFMGIWFYYPLLRSFLYSFQDISFLNPAAATFIGLKNYTEMLKDSDFWGALKNSVILTAVAVPLQSLLALFIAISLNSITRMRTLFRTLFYLPYITSTVAVTTVFMYLFMRQDGIATRFFTWFGMEDVSWYASTKYALPFLILLTIWTYVGFYVVVYLAGLQNIPKDIYESGMVDGANAWQRLVYLTIPMLKPTTFLVLTSGLIFAMQIFDQPYALARNGSLGSPAGATSTIVIYFYSQAFNFNRAGYGSAAAFIIFAIIILFTVIQKRFVKEDI